jgi:hypothetical protein
MSTIPMSSFVRFGVGHGYIAVRNEGFIVGDPAGAYLRFVSAPLRDSLGRNLV